ncbi:MAG: ATPase [Planctomyces sp.]|nr:ATPase [Planctomyces sp.]
MPETTSASVDLAAVADVRQSLEEILARVGETVVGQHHLLRGMLIGLLCRGHVLIEGVPGLAKTTAVSSLAKALGTDFSRLQFTPDLLPADVIGSEIYRPQDHRFEVQPGPIFANLVLVDEINRAPAKVQSALLEAMQERQVTIGGKTLKLPSPFMVLATQNPIDQQGTYALPEAQMDRFLMKLVVKYPAREDEEEILNRALLPGDRRIESAPVVDETQIEMAARALESIQVSTTLRNYVLDLVAATRDPSQLDPQLSNLIRYGVSPRGTIALTLAARAEAFLKNREYVIPEDVRAVLWDVFRHRMALSYEALAEELTVDDVLERLVDRVPVP